MFNSKVFQSATECPVRFHMCLRGIKTTPIEGNATHSSQICSRFCKRFFKVEAFFGLSCVFRMKLRLSVFKLRKEVAIKWRTVRVWKESLSNRDKYLCPSIAFKIGECFSIIDFLPINL